MSREDGTELLVTSRTARFPPFWEDVRKGVVCRTPFRWSLLAAGSKTCYTVGGGTMIRFILVALTIGFMSAAQAGPLHNAARAGDVDLLKELLAKGADVNQDSVSGTPLIVAAQSGQTAAARALLDAGADANLVGGELSPLQAAARAGSGDIVVMLLAEGADVTVTSRFGNTPLHLAAGSGSVAAVLALIEAGADVTARNRVGLRPAELAGASGHFDVIELLRDRGDVAADPVEPVSSLLATSDPERGRELFASTGCNRCHTVGPSDVGPRTVLWGIVGNDKASSWPIEHSEALRRVGGSWTYEDLNAWLADPGRLAPGNLMKGPEPISARGLPEVRDRADIIAFLRLQDENPEPLP